MSKPKKKSQCRFDTKSECPLAKWQENMGAWTMPSVDSCVPCRLQAVLDKMK